MKKLWKVALVVAGYVAALLAACAAEVVRQIQTSGPDVQASAGMAAFGDVALFLAVFGGLSLIPTALALWFLRPYRKFWIAFSLLSLAVAAMGPVATWMVVLDPAQQPRGWFWDIAGPFWILRVLGAPLFAFGFFVCAVVAPCRGPRWALLTVAAVDAVLSACVFIHLFVKQLI